MKLIFQLSINGISYDISNDVLSNSIEPDFSLHTSLHANTNKIAFRVNRKSSCLSPLIANAGSTNVLVNITNTDASSFFTGYLTDDFSWEIGGRGQDDFTLHAEDPGIKLLKKAWVSDNSLFTYLNGIKVCDSSSTSNSFIHKLASKAGVTLASSLPSIAQTIAFKVTDSDGKTYWDLLDKVLYEFGYVFYFDSSGKLNIYTIPQTNINPTITLAPSTNVVCEGGGTGISSKRSIVQYRETDITWNQIKTVSNIVIFHDTTGQTTTYDCLIPIAAGSYYPTGSNASTYQLTSYSSADGYSIVNVNSAHLDIASDSGLTVEYENTGSQGKLRIYNPNSITKYIYRLKIIADSMQEDAGTTIETSNKGGTPQLKYTSEYIHSQTDAKYLANLLQQYYKYASYTATVKSNQFISLGTVVNLNDGKGRTTPVCVIGSKYRYNPTSDGIRFAYYEYSVIGTGNFDISTATVNGTTLPNNDIATALSGGNLPINTPALTGSVGGLLASGNKLYVGNGNYGNADTPFLVNTQGQFSLKDKLTFDGTTLTVNGGGVFSGSLSAATGTFAGSLSAATGTFSGALSGATGTFSGSLSAATGTFSGSITATSGSFTGAVLIGSSGSLTAGDVVLNSSGISGTGYSLNSSGLALTKGSISIGNFSLSSTGNLTATNVSITGSINATSGSFSGSITSASGLIGGWTIGANSISSNASGARIVLDQSYGRISVQDSSGITQTAQGYLSGLLKNGPTWDAGRKYSINEYANYNGVIYKSLADGNINHQPPNTTYWAVSNDVWDGSAYGFWAKPSNRIVVDGSFSVKNGDMVAKDSSLCIFEVNKEIIRLGTKNGVVGLHLTNGNGNISLFTNSLGSLEVLSGTGWFDFNIMSNYVSLSTSQGGIHLDAPTLIYGGLSVFNNDYSITNVIADTGMISPRNGDGDYSNTVYCKDSNGKLRERTIQSGVWTYNFNQNLSTTSYPFFEGLNITTSNGIVSTYISATGDGASPDTVGYGIMGATRAASSNPLSYISLTRAGSGVMALGMNSSNQLIIGTPEAASHWIKNPAMIIASNGNVNINGNLAITGTVDGYDVSTLGSYLNQSLLTTASPTFAGLTVNSKTTIGQGIVESGSNSNGYYVKYNDGTLICYRYIGTPASLNVIGQRDANYYGSLTGTFPCAFYSIPAVSANYDHNQGFFLEASHIWGITTTGFNVEVDCYTYSLTAAMVNDMTWYAIGRWKA
jgi:hypothetical protein